MSTQQYLEVSWFKLFIDTIPREVERLSRKILCATSHEVLVEKSFGELLRKDRRDANNII